MKIKQTLALIFLLFGFLINSKAQTYTPKVSKDSVGVLNTRVEVLKAALKVQGLKLKEAEEETYIEKLRLKLLEANDISKESAMQNNEAAEKFKAGTIDAKANEKAAKKTKIDVNDAQKALERYNKQIDKVTALRNEIRAEERKLTYKKPFIIYDYKL